MPGRIEFDTIAYGLVVHLQLLPTSPRDDAVTFGYRPESVCLERTLTSLTRLARRRTGSGLPTAIPYSARIRPRPTHWSVKEMKEWYPHSNRVQSMYNILIIHEIEAWGK